jgi:tetratricopeptide (TPR) repeat protein
VVLAQQGDLDAALAIQEERLKVNRQLGDAGGVAAAQWDIAQILLARDRIVDALPCLSESWALFEKLGRAEGIAVVGRQFGQILLAAGHRAEGRDVLDRSAQATRKLGRIAEAEQVEQILVASAVENK